MSTTSLDILVRARDQASRTLQGVSSSTKKLDSTLTSTNAKASKTPGFFSSAAGKAAALTGGVFAAGYAAKKAYAYFQEGTREIQRADKVAEMLGTTLKSMGRNIPLNQLIEQANALERTTGIQSEVIQDGQRMFSTFGNITDEMVSNLTPSVVDFAAQFSKGNVERAAIMMGKALDNPKTGLSALSRVGVTFTEQQAEQITKMVDAGKTAKAQGVIMAALKPQIEGAGEASQTTGTRFKNAWGAMRESITRLFLPAIDAVGGALAGVFETLGSADIPGIIGKWGQFAKPVLSLIANLFRMLVDAGKKLWAFLKGDLQKVWRTISEVMRKDVFPALKVIWNAFRKNVLPVLKVVAVVVGAVIAVLLKLALKVLPVLIKYIGFAIKVWAWLYDKLTAVVKFIVTRVVGAFQTVGRVAKDAWNGIKNVWNGALDFFSGIGEGIKSMFAGVWNAVAGFWNSTVGSLGFTVPNWVPKIGGSSFEMPNIPTLDMGGVVQGPGLAYIGPIKEAMIPESKWGASAGNGGSGPMRGRLFLDLENATAIIDLLDERTEETIMSREQFHAKQERRG